MRKRPDQIIRAALTIAALAPAAFVAYLIAKYGVNLIHWDEWEVASIFEKMTKGAFPINELLAQHVQHRMAVPRLIILGIAGIAKWDVRYEMAFSFVLLCLISFALYRLGVMTVKSPVPRAVLILMSNLLIFSPIQAYNMLDGHQMCVFLPAACVITSVVIACSRRVGLAAKTVMCAALTTLSAFSLANGLIGWVVVLPIIVLAAIESRSGAKRVWIVVLAWFLFFAVNIFMFFNGFKAPPPDVAPAITDSAAAPIASLKYFFASLGIPVFSGGLIPAVFTGAAVLLLWSFIALAVFRYLKEARELLYRAMGWFAVGSYGALSAALITLGRASWSAADPMPPMRYMSFSLYFAVSLPYLAVVVYESYDKRRGRGLYKNSGLISVAAVLIFFILQSHTYAVGISQMRLIRQDRVKGKANLIFMDVIDNEKELDKFVYPVMRAKKATARYLDSVGMINPSLLKSGRIDDIKGDKPEGAVCGYFSGLNRTFGGNYAAFGWASLPLGNGPADAVILAYDIQGKGPVAFRLACDMGSSRYYHNPARRDCVWETTFPESEAPPASAKMSAWAFDMSSGKAYKLENEHFTDTDNDRGGGV